MSGYVAGLVWKAQIPQATLTEKGVLALYGDVAHDDGTHIYRSKASIAERAQASKDTIKRVTRWLLKSRLLVVVRRSDGGRYRNTTEYKIDLELLKSLAGDLGDGRFQRATAQIIENLYKQDDSEGVHTAPPVTIETWVESAGGANSTRVESAPGADSTHEGVHTAPPGGAPMHPLKRNRPGHVQDTSTGASASSEVLEALWRAGTQPMRRRSSRKRVSAALAQTSEPPERVLAGLQAYVEQDEDVAAGRGQPALHRWIADERYQPWLEAAAPPQWTDGQWRSALRLVADGATWRPAWPPRDQCPAHILVELREAADAA